MRPPRYTGAELLVALVLLIVSAPFVQDLPQGDLVESVLLSVVMVSAVLAVGGRGRALGIALVLLAPALGGKWLDHLYPGFLPPSVFLVASIAFFVFVVVRLPAFVVRGPPVDTAVLCAAISGFMILGLIWAPAYLAVAQAFRRGCASGAGQLQRLLLQLHHALQGRLRRHHAGLEGRPDADDGGSDHWAVLHGGGDLAPGLGLLLDAAGRALPLGTPLHGVQRA
jgi:hypothetical protein